MRVMSVSVCTFVCVYLPMCVSACVCVFEPVSGKVRSALKLYYLYYVHIEC